ncbi:MAG: hypothetical protein ACKVU4_01720 [Phycisphaerales bacterium]
MKRCVLTAMAISAWACVGAAGCASGGQPRATPDRGATLEENFARAKAAHEADPGNEDAAIWHGRRLAYLGRYTEAIGVYSDALRLHPNSFRLLRHRGHRFITVRELDLAIADLDRAAILIEGVPDEVEPDGAPNAQNKPRSTSHSNIWYHLALAHYLKGDFARAADAWARCMEFSRGNDDMLVATSYWLYLSLRRAGRTDGAGRVLEPIRAGMDVIENHAYHRLLLLYKGELTEDQVRGTAGDGPGETAVADATVGYGLAVWRLIRGDRAGARVAFERVLNAGGSNRAAFGFIAAEAELAR